MGAQYSLVATRAAGEVITAANYNADHQNHIDNGDAVHLGGEATNAGALQSTTDPFPAQAATDTGAAYVIQRDIRHLRYIVGQLASVLNGGSGIAAATTALGTSLANWYVGIRNPGLKTVGARVTNTATFAYTTAGLKAVTYDTETYDQDGAAAGFHSTSANTSRLTVPANCGGKYNISACGQWASNANTGTRTLAIRLNGTTVIAATGQSVSATNSTFDQAIALDYPLAAGDYVEVVVESSANMNFGGPQATTASSFSIHLIGS